ncbi:hypothetical protein BC777_2736 [Yoonia maricola]|uniref:50S ribosomal protein L35 n=1 Tax=Yoonia maricola TaxID=420999 RepID=A0A2M8W609_9RHOB|nr:hypothetical protein [Yoonia maricola]PJI86367.1 hypothetical protein BC777_2736 [Yoonia maricola]
MDFDHIFVLGIVLIAFAIPSAVSAYSDGQRPKTALIMALLGAGAIIFVVRENPGVYALDTVDDVIVTVVGDLINN